MNGDDDDEDDEDDDDERTMIGVNGKGNG